ncbi:MAG TPA: FG-GAP-like repeat-containing protein, partial [Candidatus Didemnitutus sp.]|nr:FG-GAP-like repeat-containing protein [Candidatus Didemnitutus sp.]
MASFFPLRLLARGVQILIGTAFLAYAPLALAQHQYWTQDTSFSPLFESDYYAYANALLSYPGGKILTSGQMVDSQVVDYRYVRLNSDGSIDPSLSLPANCSVAATYPDGRMLTLTYTDLDTVMLRLDRRLSDGSIDGTFTPESLRQGPTVSLLADGKIAIFGTPVAVGSSAASYVTILDADGAIDNTFEFPIAYDPNSTGPVVTNVVETTDSTHFLVTGGFLFVAGAGNNVIRLNLDGSLDATFDTSLLPVTGISVTAIYPNADGTMLVANGTPMCRLTSTGAVDSSFVTSLTGTGIVFGPRQADGKIFYTSNVSSDPLALNQLHRMNVDGTDDVTLTGNAITYLGSITFPALADDGSFYLYSLDGGRQAAGLGISHYSGAGLFDSTFNPNFGFFAQLSQYARQPDGKHLVSGAFDHVNGTPVATFIGFIRLNDNGTLDTGFSVPDSVTANMSDFHLQPSGKILVHGLFPAGTGNPPIYVKRLNADGSLDSTFPTLTDSLFIQCVGPDGSFYAASAGATTHLRRYSADGVIDAGFGPDLGVDDANSAVAFADGTIAVETVNRSVFPYEYGLTLSAHDGTPISSIVTGEIDLSTAEFYPLADNSLTAVSHHANLPPAYSSSQYVQYEVDHLPGNSLPDYEFTTSISDGTVYTYNASPDMLFAIAGSLFDVERATSPVTVEINFDHLRGDDGTVLWVRSDGQLMYAQGGANHAAYPLARYTRTNLTSPSVDPGPTIVPLPPTTTSLPLNAIYSASAYVHGLAPFNYTWFKDGTPLTGPYQNLFGIVGVKDSDVGAYSFHVSNAYGQATSGTIDTLSILPGYSMPTLTAEPADQHGSVGGAATFTAGITGDGTPHYQWFHNGDTIAGANSATLSLTDIGHGDAGSYHLEVNSTLLVNGLYYFGYITSTIVQLILPTPQDFNGDGKSDLVWTNTTTGDRSVWFMNGTAIDSFGYLANIDPVWHIVGTGDFNADGKTDLVWENLS